MGQPKARAPTYLKVLRVFVLFCLAFFLANAIAWFLGVNFINVDYSCHNIKRLDELARWFVGYTGLLLMHKDNPKVFLHGSCRVLARCAAVQLSGFHSYFVLHRIKTDGYNKQNLVFSPNWNYFNLWQFSSSSCTQKHYHSYWSDHIIHINVSSIRLFCMHI